MAQEYVISNAFPAKDKDGNEKTWDSQYGTFKVWKLYFENDDTAYETNKKLDFEGFKKGDTVYGTTSLTQYGGKFKSEQRPLGQLPTSTGNSPASPAQASGDLDAKLDYLISMVEVIAEKVSGPTDTVLEDIDDKPIDLSEIPF